MEALSRLSALGTESGATAVTDHSSKFLSRPILLIEEIVFLRSPLPSPSTIATMADEKRSASAPSRTPSIEAGAPQVSSTMLANTESDKLPPSESKETPISSSSSSTMQNRPRNRRTLAGLHRVKIGAGIVRDIRARAPWYWSDWKDAWNYRVLPATALVFFAK